MQGRIINIPRRQKYQQHVKFQLYSTALTHVVITPEMSHVLPLQRRKYVCFLRRLEQAHIMTIKLKLWSARPTVIYCLLTVLRSYLLNKEQEYHIALFMTDFDDLTTSGLDITSSQVRQTLLCLQIWTFFSFILLHEFLAYLRNVSQRMCRTTLYMNQPGDVTNRVVMSLVRKNYLRHCVFAGTYFCDVNLLQRLKCQPKLSCIIPSSNLQLEISSSKSKLQ